MAVQTPSVSITLDDKAMDPARQRTLRSLDVDCAVHEQASFKMRLAIGQDANGDWAKYAEQTFKPYMKIGLGAKFGDAETRLINGVLTQVKMNFKAEPCESEIELTGMDVLELLKSANTGKAFKGHDITSIVEKIFSQNHSIEVPDTSRIPKNGTPNPNRDVIMQAHDDLEFLRKLADTVNCEVYVEPNKSSSQAHFEPLDLQNATEVGATIYVNQGLRTNVRGSQFYYDLTGPTIVEASYVDAHGKHPGSVRKELRELLVDKDKALLGPPGFEKVQKLDRHGRETKTDLERLCETELEKLSWVVIGKGELDTSAFGDVLMPRHRVQVNGAGSSFDGKYLVWKVTHSFTRELYCQKFELRRKLEVKKS